MGVTERSLAVQSDLLVQLIQPIEGPLSSTATLRRIETYLLSEPLWATFRRSKVECDGDVEVLEIEQ